LSYKNTMEKNITLNDTNVAYTLRRSARSWRMRLAVYRDGSVVVTAPSKAPVAMTERFLAAKAKWLLSKLEYFSKRQPNPLSRLTRTDYITHKDEILLIIQQKVEYFNTLYGYRYQKISIKSQKTRWGSCSRKGNLNFNYKLFFMPERIQNYVVVHELCHLEEFNHSKRFWGLVARAIPDYVAVRKELRERGLDFQ
jgi:predicted metal-dependent hydrolase